MAQYTAIPVQTVASMQNVLFTEDSIPCNKGYIVHRIGSGLFTFKGASPCRARYKVTFDANIVIAAGGVVAPISIAIAVNGEALGNATAIVTPAAVGDFNNVSLSVFIDVPSCCCLTVAVENTSTQAIDVENANLIFERVA